MKIHFFHKPGISHVSNSADYTSGLPPNEVPHSMGGR